MAKRLRIVGATLLAVSGVGIAFASCSSPDGREEIGQSVASLSPTIDAGDGGAGPLMPGTPLTPWDNFSVTGSIFGNHEVHVAPAAHLVGQALVYNWVAGMNATPSVGNTAWAVSWNLDASRWDASQDGPLAFGNPCDGASTPCMSDNTPFLEPRGDPSLATVTQTDVNDGDGSIVGQRVLYTMIARSQKTPPVDTDVMVSISTNGGHTFGHSYLLTHGDAVLDAGTGGGTSGGSIDNPVIASSFAEPNGGSTYAAWTVSSGPPGQPGFFNVGYIRQVLYDHSLNFVTTGMQESMIPTGGYTIFHPAVAVGTLAMCSGAHEAVYVAWASTVAASGGEGCRGYPESPVAVAWLYHVYDTVTQAWLVGGPFYLDFDPAWPRCVGSPIDGGRAASDNDMRPRIAAEPSADFFWIAYIQSSNYGTRMTVRQQNLQWSGGSNCDTGSWQNTSNDPPWHPTPTCWNTQGGCDFSGDGGDGGPGYNSPDGGGYTVNDQWGPAIAFVRDPSGNRKLLATWYTTKLDFFNQNVTIFGASNVGFGAEGGMPLSEDFQVGTDSGSCQVPWNHYNAPWYDYQALASEPSGKFLAAWGGDLRDASVGAGPGVWSAVIQ